MPETRVALFAHADVGRRFLEHLLAHHSSDLEVLVVQPGSEVEAFAHARGVACIVDTGVTAKERLRDALARCAVAILCWWPRLIPADLLALPRHGFVNTHPSLLPHNRGKHPNFWAIVERRPYGVSLHEVTPGIDAGAVIAQAALAVGWEDTGQTLHERSREAMLALLVETYPLVRTGSWTARPQELQGGSFHLASELDGASRIDLDRHYTGRELLDLLRARTYPGHPGCRFSDGGTEYEARIEIRKANET